MPTSLRLFPLLLLLLAARSHGEDVSSGDATDVCASRSDGESPSCPVNCFRADPVCGADGVTYWCGCPEAACAGVRVTKRGACAVGNGGTGLVSGQAFLLLHIVWLIVLGFTLLFGFL
ncbi:uncharacterized protein LOC121987798 [Zingiber officinale]|uniref:Kazal-like domain-containing protein n=1 Tax=Zingiber officinale TaxID=94328 RepID=A0A8J5L3Z8_ZINOF|nr:uncharacterized protein LOC121987798 [Zingiber officinale]KAG6504912.1 hypothetical protein ZIOFF_037260 [Zingiber officinale]